MKTISKKIALGISALLMGAMLFAETAVTDFAGAESGAKYAKASKWANLLETAAGEKSSGKITWSKSVKKLYKALGLKDDKIIFYSIQTGNDKDFVNKEANNVVHALAATEITQNAQELLDERLADKKHGNISPVREIAGFARAGTFWVEQTTGDKVNYIAYSVWQITELNYKEAGKRAVADYMTANGFAKTALDSNER